VRTDAPRKPWAVASIVLVGAAVALHLIPGAPEALEFQRGVLATQPWRVLTAQVVHYPGDHLIWDLGMFALLAPLLELRDRRVFAATLAVGALLIPFSVLLFAPEITTYRGLSGIDTALFGALAVLLYREFRAHDDRRGLWILAAQVALLVVKLTYEHTTGNCLLVTNEGWVPLAGAHIVGFLAGIACSWAIVDGARQGCATGIALRSEMNSNPAG